jgi:hypothetical protein
MATLENAIRRPRIRQWCGLGGIPVGLLSGSSRVEVHGGGRGWAKVQWPHLGLHRGKGGHGESYDKHNDHLCSSSRVAFDATDGLDIFDEGQHSSATKRRRHGFCRFGSILCPGEKSRHSMPPALPRFSLDGVPPERTDHPLW